MKRIFIFASIITAYISSLATPMVSAQVSNADYAAAPPFISTGVPPLVMMVMGRDHKLYYEAYNDASDIDEDGKLDVGYKSSIYYYGYFDPYKCYTYDTTGTARFKPVGATDSNKYCGAGSGYWSGNFLNWMTTSRIDALRKVLYGGYRSTDNSGGSGAVLESEYKPQDAHSWGKEYAGNDTNKLTPYNDPSGGTLPGSAVTWGGTSTDNKLLLVVYDDAGGKPLGQITGDSHDDLIASYSTCDYTSSTLINDFNNASINPSSNHRETSNFFLVTEFDVVANRNGANQGGNWEFAIDGDDGVELEIFPVNASHQITGAGTVVASHYGGHGACNCQTYSGTINLTAGNAYRMVVRHRENDGNDGVRVYYRSPNQGDTNWRVFGTETNTTRRYYVTFRAPNNIVGATTETIRLMHHYFIATGEPAYNGAPAVGSEPGISSDAITGCGKHLLFCMTSKSEDATPVIRLLKDKTNRIWEWASKERPVCDNSLGTPEEFFIRVEVCNETIGLEPNCKEYPGGGGANTLCKQYPTCSWKPAGLFQKYGESTEKVCSKSFKSCDTTSECSGAPEECIDRGRMFFGLMTGSYEKNLSGGVVRWNIDSITHAVDNRNVGQIKTGGSTGNMITTLNRLRTYGFKYSDKTYQFTDTSHPVGCGWIMDRGLAQTDSCKMWGNPIGEMMYEAERYFAGKSAPTSDFSDGTGTSGSWDSALVLTNQGNPANNWIAPYEKYPICSKPFMIILSDINPSYDDDQLPGSRFSSFTGDLTGLNVGDGTDLIGTTEGIIAGTDVFIQESNGVADTICSAKNVSGGLSRVRGLCPEEPTKRGTYYSAAVAHYGKTQFSANNSLSSGLTYTIPNITTYSVALLSPVPEIKIKVGTKEIKIVPIGKTVSDTAPTHPVVNSCWNKCAPELNTAQGLKLNCTASAYCPSNQIVDFYVENLTDTEGNFKINFEDAEQGADHDMDAIVEYHYKVNTDNTVTVSLDSTYASGYYSQVMGFVISGVGSEDGVYLPVRDDDSNGDTNINSMPKSWTHTFTPSTTGSAAKLLHDPLWYAAKWGGFDDQNGNNVPDLQDEWDKDHDGVPDTYFLISNPLKMEQQLTKVFEDILKKSASGTSVSVLATSSEGEGALYQAYFYPEKNNDTDNSKKTWLGYVRGLFLDSYGNLREDTTDDNHLIYQNDRILRMYLDDQNTLWGQLYDDLNGDGVRDNSLPDATVPIDSVKALWEAGDMLAKRDKSTRNIYVWLDTNNNSTVVNGDFSNITGQAALFNDSNASLLMPYLATTSTTTAANIINFVRGNPIAAGLRDRCLPVVGAASAEGTCSSSCTNCPAGASQRNWVLGDIVYSTPTTVGSPKEQYDQIYADSSYLAFRKAYRNRRNVIYLGGNDGMLHAFNAGVYHTGNDSSTAAVDHGWFVANPSSGTVPDLGDELWAFVPYDNLPHLQWLTNPTYSHVYYVDLKPKVTDVRIFNDSATSFTGGINGQNGVSHPNGWGTIVIVGMRLGGGAMPVTADFGSGVQTRTFKSSFYVLDVTDPEKPPKLLWRFTDNGLGFTSSYPGIAHIKTNSEEKWFMVVGSGPDNNAPSGTRGYEGTSTQIGRVYIVNLMDGTLANSFTTDANSFMGDPTIVDWDLDYTTDTIYIGSVMSTTSGKVYRINTNRDPVPANWTLTTLINQGKPVLVGPSATIDRFNTHWVLFGTGRLWGTTDKTNSDQQTLYGIKDACWRDSSTCTTPYSLSDLTDTSNLAVCSSAAGANSGKIYNTTTGTCGSGSEAYASYAALLTAMRATSNKGWYMNLVNTADPSERVLSKSVVLGGMALFTAFTPSTDPCAFQGTSSLYAVYLETGTAYSMPVIGTSGTGTSETIKKSVALGKGLPTTVGVAIGKATKGYVQTSTGAIVEINIDPAFGVRSGPESWKEKGGGIFGIEEIYKHIVK